MSLPVAGKLMIRKVSSKPNHEKLCLYALKICNELTVQEAQPGQKETPERDVIVAVLATAGMSTSLSILASFSVPSHNSNL